MTEEQVGILDPFSHGRRRTQEDRWNGVDDGANFEGQVCQET